MDATLEHERDELVREIYDAFAGVSREGGVSWSEAGALDGPGAEDAVRRELRAQDTDSCWTQLVADPRWDSAGAFGRFPFLDAIGTRYYLPAAMVRCVHSGQNGPLQSHLTAPPRGRRSHEEYVQRWALLNGRQHRCVARFVRFMANLSFHKNDDIDFDAWNAARNTHWDAVG